MIRRDVASVVFDLDGVLIDSEGLWERSRREVTEECGGRWDERASVDTLGMSTPEWAAYIHEQLDVSLPPQEIEQRVVARMERLLLLDLPLMAGAREAVERLAARWPLALATSSTPRLVRLVLGAAGIAECFKATVTAEQAGRGKPAPDVYLAALAALGAAPSLSVAIEDSTNGLRSAHDAGMSVIAIPNSRFPPSPAALALADTVIPSLEELSLELVGSALKATPEPT